MVWAPALKKNPYMLIPILHTQAPEEEGNVPVGEKRMHLAGTGGHRFFPGLQSEKVFYLQNTKSRLNKQV